MKKLLPLLLLLSFYQTIAQPLESSRRSGYYRYIFRISDGQACTLYRKGMDRVTDDYFHTVVDSFPAGKAYGRRLPVGHYLFAQAEAGQLVFEFRSVNQLQVKLLNNKRDLTVHLHDSQGRPISDAQVYIRGKNVPWQPRLSAYQLRKNNRRGLLAVSYRGFISYHPVETQYRTSRATRTLKRILYSVPLRYTWQPFRDVVLSVRYGSPWGMVESVVNLFDADARKARFQRRRRGFIAFSKPRYRPGDTVGLKAVVLTRRGRPVNREVTLRLQGNRKSTRLTTLKPYRKGAYEYRFVLHDSLKLSLDTYYAVYLENPKGKPYLNEGFRYEDYELKANTFKVRAAHKEHYPGQPQALFMKGTDENELNLMDARAEITVLPDRVSAMTSRQVFVPDTLWQHRLPLEPVGETKLVLPDSLFPALSLGYKVEAVFLNASNERHTEQLSLRYGHHPQQLRLEVKSDSLQAVFLTGGKSMPKAAHLTAFSADDDTLFSQTVQLPFSGRISPYADYYELQADSLSTTLELLGEAPLISCLSDRTADSVFIRMQNPRRIPFWYTIYRQNTRLGSGYGDTLYFAAAESTSRKYFLSLQYVWQGEVREEEYEVPFFSRQLRIGVDQPAVVYPGQKARIGISVTDAEGAPVAGADVTAWGVTKKFKEAGPPRVPDMSRVYRSRRLYNSFRFKEEYEQEEMEGKKRLNYPVWREKAGLDSLAYYQFLYPEGGIYRYTMPAPDSLTQLSPYVVHCGEVLPVNIILADSRPVYIRTAGQSDPYAFPLDSGYHSLTLRTRGYRIHLDSVYLPHGQKLILSADTRVPHPGKRVDSSAFRLTAQELNLLSYYLMPYRNTFGNAWSYLKQGNRILRLSPAPSGAAFTTGPVYPNLAEVIVKDGYRTEFTFESGYEYHFEPGLLKMKSSPKYPYKFYWFPDPGRIQPDFRQSAWTEREMDSLWRKSRETAVTTREYFDNPTGTEYGYGKLFLHDIEYPRQHMRSVKRLLLLKENDPNFLRVYPGTTRLLHGLEKGSYKIMLLLQDNYYLEQPAIRVEANGTGYLQIRAEAILPPDRRSRQLDSLVTELVSKTVVTVKDQRSELQTLKETYNQTWNVTGTTKYSPADFYHLVQGVVTDHEGGDPLPGVNVVVKGTSTGTVTDATGAFSLYTPPNAVLTFSFIGYMTEDILIGGRSEVQIKLTPDVKQLSEVVVVGYGTSTRRDITGAISTIQGGLSGSAPGVMVRGAASLGGNGQPLIIVDGVPYKGSESDLDPNSVSSVETLAGPTATAIYGSRGANGVVIITTRGSKTTGALLPVLPGAPPEGAAQTASLRNRFSDNAYWQPRLTTDKDGKTSFEATFPDDITSWRTFVAAVGSKKRTGVAESQVKAFKTLTGILALPRFMVEGDSTAVIGKVLNYTADTVDVKTTFEVNGKVGYGRSGKVIHSLIDTLVISAASADSLRVKYYVQKEDGYMDGELRPVPVFAKGVKETKGQFLNLEKDTTLTLRFHPNMGKVSLYAQADVLQILLDEIDQVRRYEYLCNEQVASKLKSLLAEKKIREYLGQPFTHGAIVRRLVRKLEEARGKEGGWGWWPDAPFSTWISAHVTEALVAAGQNGYGVRPDRQELTDYLVYALEGMPRTDKLQALRLLHGLNAKVDFGRYTKALEKDTTLSFGQHLELLEIRQLTGQPYKVDTLLKTAKQSAFGNLYWGRESYHLLYSDIAMTLTAYRILKRKGGYEPQLARIRGFLLEKRSSGFWRNTYESASILETILPDLLNGTKNVKPSRLVLAGAVNSTVTTFPWEAELSPGDSLVIRKEGNLPLYLTAYQQYWNSQPEKVEKDFIVATHFKGQPQRAVQLKAGKPVNMLVEVNVKRESDYVMIEVPIPAGCSYEEKRGYQYGEVHREYFRHKVSIFCGTLRPGKYTFTVTLLPRYSGSYTVNPAKAELMYFPTFFGRSEPGRVKVQ